MTLCSSPPGLTRWSMPNGRVQFGPTSVLRSSMDHRVKPGGDEERGPSHGAATTNAKLSGAAHARRVAGAAVGRAQRFDPARAVRFVGIVPLLRQKTLPPG